MSRNRNALLALADRIDDDDPNDMHYGMSLGERRYIAGLIRKDLANVSVSEYNHIKEDTDGNTQAPMPRV